ncbi:MAG: acetate kinase [bacterium]
MKVLVINAGSSSLKFTMYRMSGEQMLAKGMIERIGMEKPQLKYERHDGLKINELVTVGNHDDALRLVCEKLVDPNCGVLRSLAEVQAIGHRVVHGGEKCHDSVRVTEIIAENIRECFALAPLHNPSNLGAIEACERVFPGVANVAVFDTAFHSTMPAESYLFAIPYEYYTKFGIRKYGFHGTSHKYVTYATAHFLGKPVYSLRLITCHLGNGCSVAAVNSGNVLDTSMGMTPLMGLVMGTRCGDIDPAVVLHLTKQGMTADEVDAMLNKQSGLLGIAGLGTSDMRDIISAVESGHTRATQALEMFIHRLVFYIGAYHTLLGGADAVVFTGGIGENSAYIRGRIIPRLNAIGCHLDPEKNQVMGKAAIVSTADSAVQAIVMPTNEELMIARETVRVIKGG